MKPVNQRGIHDYSTKTLTFSSADDPHDRDEQRDAEHNDAQDKQAIGYLNLTFRLGCCPCSNSQSYSQKDAAGQSSDLQNQSVNDLRK